MNARAHIRSPLGLQESSASSLAEALYISTVIYRPVADLFPLLPDVPVFEYFFLRF
jgi:hypothetical protein